MTSSFEPALPASELAEGEMRPCEIQGRTLLLTRIKGEIRAMEAHCCHYGAPLAEGLLHRQRLYCPWHHACFDATSGRQLEPCGLDHLHTYPVRETAGMIHVDVDASRVAPHPSPPPLDPACRRVLILGAGAAAMHAASELRDIGYDGDITLVSREDTLPYDRPALSKDWLGGTLEASYLPLRDEAFFRDRDIRLLTGHEVTGFEVAQRQARLDDGTTLEADAVLIATGSAPRTLPLAGHDLPEVCLLRSRADAEYIMALAEKARRVAVVGDSFIGLEVASHLQRFDVEVSLLAHHELPLKKILGEPVARAIRQLFEDNGVEYMADTEIQSFTGNDKLTGLNLNTGRNLPADLAVVGVGVTPATGYVAGLDLADDGAVPVDDFLRAAKGVYAAGDVALFPYWQTASPIRVEHWRLACEHGRLAGRNMVVEAAARERYRGLPFFWSEWFGKGLYYVGHAGEFDEMVIHGDPGAFDFVAYYCRGGEPLAAAGINRNREMDAIHELLRLERLPPADELRQSFDPLARLAEL